jgi:hypothetical protein
VEGKRILLDEEIIDNIVYQVSDILKRNTSRYIAMPSEVVFRMEHSPTGEGVNRHFILPYIQSV